MFPNIEVKPVSEDIQARDNKRKDMGRAISQLHVIRIPQTTREGF